MTMPGRDTETVETGSKKVPPEGKTGSAVTSKLG